MKRIRSNFIKLFSGFIAGALLIAMPSTVIANTKTPPAKIPQSTPTVEKAITWGGSGDDTGIATAVDGAGNIYVTGYFNGSVDFNPGDGNDPHNNNGGRDVFLSKFDSNRNFLWAKTWGGSGDERGESVAVDSLGNVYVSGPFQSTVDFNPLGGASHTSNSGIANNIYLSKFASDGTFQWVKTWGPSDGGAESYSIAIDASNNIYVVGDFSGSTCDFNPWGAHDWHPNHPAGSLGRLFDAYLSKFDSNGNFLWAKTWGGEGYDDGPGVAVDSLGNVYVGGMYASQTINFDPAGGSGGLGHPASDSGILVDVFLSKFNSSGTFQWVKTWGGAGVDDVGQTVTVDKLNNVYIGGRFGCANCDFDTGTGSNPHSSHGVGDLDAFVSKFDSSGSFLWAKSWGGSGWDAVGGLTTDSSNNVYTSGPFKNNVDFGPGTEVLANGTMWDAFLSKLDSSGSFQWVKTWGGTSHDVSNKLSSDATGNIYVPGWYTGTVDFAPGNGGDIHTSAGTGGDVFLLVINDPPSTNTISGNAGVAGATLSYTDGTAKTTTADLNGNYSITVSYNWSGTVTPSKTNYAFTPTQKNYTNNITNLTGQNYAATPTKPDLIITNATVNPVSPGVNQTFEVNITIKNQGATGGANTIFRDVYIDRDPSTLLDPITGCPPPGDFFESDSYPSLPAGMTDTKTVTITGGLPYGSHKIWVYVDARCLVDEGGGNNNAP